MNFLKEVWPEFCSAKRWELGTLKRQQQRQSEEPRRRLHPAEFVSVVWLQSKAAVLSVAASSFSRQVVSLLVSCTVQHCKCCNQLVLAVSIIYGIMLNPLSPSFNQSNSFNGQNHIYIRNRFSTLSLSLLLIFSLYSPSSRWMRWLCFRSSRHRRRVFSFIFFSTKKPVQLLQVGFGCIELLFGRRVAFVLNGARLVQPVISRRSLRYNVFRLFFSFDYCSNRSLIATAISRALASNINLCLVFQLSALFTLAHLCSVFTTVPWPSPFAGNVHTLDQSDQEMTKH